jgi:hypothetical protein
MQECEFPAGSSVCSTPDKPFIWQKICNVAKTIFKAALSVFLYWTNPTIFSIGFLAGVIRDDQVRQVIQKITGVWNTLWNAQPLSISFFGGLAGFLSLPVTLAASSLLWAAHLGSIMSREAQRLMTENRTSQNGIFF